MPVGVSIPFIAGQWSLRRGGSAGAAGPGPRFNPLHCGAVVASRRRRLTGTVPKHGFQSPSLRGSGRFTARREARLRGRRGVSIPFIAGQWSLRQEAERRARDAEVSIPFIAGQWSLRHGVGRRRRRRRRVSIPFIAGQWSLHGRSVRRKTKRGRVSIPFIAGQWSLLMKALPALPPERGFQSPSLRGSGRFRQSHLMHRYTPILGFQSPSLRGSGRFVLDMLR